MEYFSACFIYSDISSKKEEIINKMYKSENITFYENVLDIYYDIDQDTFNRVIIRPLLHDYLKYLGDTIVVDELKLIYKQYTYLRIFYRGMKVSIISESEDSFKACEKIKSELGVDVHSLSHSYNFVTADNHEDRFDIVRPNFVFTTDLNTTKIIEILKNKKTGFI